jgi:MOSC domain-containing protein YiiM
LDVDGVVKPATRRALESGLDEIRRSPRDQGRIELIVRRPAVEEREVVAEADLDPVEGLVGDGWRTRGSKATADGSAHPQMQLTLMNARAAALMAGERNRWPLAGDQLYVDLDLSETNLPPGTRVEIGSAVLEITAESHLGCGKFSRRFGVDALKFVNSDAGRELHLRGIYAKVVSAGTVRTGDEVRKVATAGP